MSKDRKKLLHIHSSVNDKQPTPATLELGELGVNNAKGNAFISTKNSDGEVVRFSEDETIIGWMEQKEVFPYEGYIRGADESQVDGVTEQDLLNNKSNLIIKLNQVVPQDTDYSPYDEKVNGAKDIYGNLINPISSGDYKDGAGIAIDMSKYAMLGANPSFSSITTTCHTTLNGTTEINGKDDACGSKFSVEVADACIEASDTLNEYGVNHSNFGVSCDGTDISNDTTLKGKKVLIDSPSGDLTVDIQACNHISARTNDFVISECQDNAGKVEIETTDIKASADTTDINSCNEFKVSTDSFVIEQCNSGVTHIHSCSGITLESKNVILTDGDCGNGEVTIDTNDLCLVGEEKINVYGDKTNVGLDCDDSKIATTTNVYGKAINLEGEKAEIHLDTNGDLTETASRNICDNAVSAATFYGASETNIGINCDDTATASTTNVKGERVIVHASVQNLGLTAKQDIVESAEGTIFITADDNVCIRGGEETDLFGYEKTQVGKDCNGNKSNDIVLWRTPNGNEITAETVDEAIDEAFDRSKVTLSSSTASSGTTYSLYQDSGRTLIGNIDVENYDLTISGTPGPSSGETAMTYTFYQNGQQIGEINIPKDHTLNDANIVYGVYDETTGKFTPCTSSTITDKTVCEYYIEFTFNVFSGDTGHSDTKKVYLEATDLVEIVNVADSDSVKMYKSINGKSTTISAETSVIVSDGQPIGKGQQAVASNGRLTLTSRPLVLAGDSGSSFSSGTTKQFIPLTETTGETTINMFDLNVNIDNGVEGRVVTKNYNPLVSSTTIDSYSLTVNAMSRNDYFSGITASTTYSPMVSASTINIPTKLQHLSEGVVNYDRAQELLTLGNNGTINVDGAKESVYIRGTYDFDYEEGFHIHTDDQRGCCVTISGDVCCSNYQAESGSFGGNITAVKFYATSDKRNKDNIVDIVDDDIKKVESIGLKSFNFKGDDRKVYGVIAQDVDENGLSSLVHKDDNGMMSVDYTSFLILKLASLEDKLEKMQAELDELKNNK